MPHPHCYNEYIRGWETNDGGVMINDPRLGGIIPELESEEIRIGSFPHVIADVRPDMYLDIATVVAVWEEKHIAVARMHMYGVTITGVRKSKKVIEKMRAAGTLTKDNYYSIRTFLGSSTGIYTRDDFDWCVRRMEDGYFLASRSIHGRNVRVTGCTLYIHSQTD